MKNIQRDLIKLGFGEYLRPFGADGINGTKTKLAVRTFQRAYNSKFNKKILVDGIAGSQTRNALSYWVKVAGTYGTSNFNITEFMCRGKMIAGGMNSQLLVGLEQLRYNLGGHKIVINSGYRCSIHNRAVGGIPNSEHLYGRAADIRVVGVLPSKVYATSDKIFKGVGSYRTFTHVDNGHKRIRFTGGY